MQIEVKFGGQLRTFIGTDNQYLELAAFSKLTTLFELLAQKGTDVVKQLLDPAAPTILAFINNEQVMQGQNPILHEKDVITLLSPMSGG